MSAPLHVVCLHCDSVNRLPRGRLAKIDTDREQTLSARLGIRGIPPLILSSGGREVARSSGAMDLGGLLAWTDRHLG